MTKVSEQHSPLNVVIFANSPLCVNTIAMLMQQKQLVGVILSEENTPLNQQFQAWLQSMEIAYIQCSSANVEKITQQLTQWATDLAISFAVEPSQLNKYANIPRYGLYHCHCAAFPTLQGGIPLYWQVREQAQHTKIILHKADITTNDSMNEDIAYIHTIAIHPLDTLQAIENKITIETPTLINNFVQKVHHQQGRIELTASVEEVFSAPTLQEQDIKIDWLTMSSEKICALIRAGNTHMGGSIVSLNNTQLNVLQATQIAYETYGVSAGTICHTGEPDGIIVATHDAAIRLDIITNADGIFSGITFCERFQITAGMAFTTN